jgi:hypothetical protein
VTATRSTRTTVLRFLTAAVLTFALAASLTLVSTPASACTTTLGTPWKLLGPARVAVKVTNGTCNTNLPHVLERSRWWGWQQVAHKKVLKNQTFTLKKDCADLRGTYTYRAAVGNTWHWHAGPKRRITC